MRMRTCSWIPTAELADIVLPAASPFELTRSKSVLNQPRRGSRGPAAAAGGSTPGEARWDGNRVRPRRPAGSRRFLLGRRHRRRPRHQLGPSGVTLDELRRMPGGVEVTLSYASPQIRRGDGGGNPRGFRPPHASRDLLADLSGARLRAAAGIRGTDDEPATQPTSPPAIHSS